MTVFGWRRGDAVVSCLTMYIATCRGKAKEAVPGEYVILVNGSPAELPLTERIELRGWDGFEGFLVGDAKLCEVALG